MYVLMLLTMFSMVSTLASILIFRVHPFALANLIIFAILFLITGFKMKKMESDEKETEEVSNNKK